MLALEPELSGLSAPAQQQAAELEPAYAEFRDQVRFWVQRVAVPSIMVVGLFGNLITMIIMTRRRMRSTTNLYLAALAFVDMLYLVLTFLLGLSHYPNMAGYKYYIYWKARPFLMMLTDACSNTSVWLIVSFTIERYIAVKYPMKGKVWCTEARAKILIMSVFLFGTLFASPVPFEWKVIEKKTSHQQQHSLDNQKNSIDRMVASNYDDATTNLTLNPNVDSASNGLRSKVNDSIPTTTTTLDGKSYDDSLTLALDYTDFGRNETYKTYYYALTALIFYFVPLLSLMLFNGFLIKSVHQSRRERTKLTRRPSCQQSATACNNANTNTGGPKPHSAARALEHVAAISSKADRYSSNKTARPNDGTARRLFKDSQIRLRLLLAAVRPTADGKRAKNKLAPNARGLSRCSLDKCGQHSPLISEKQETEAVATSTRNPKRMSSPENLFTQSARPVVANDRLTSSSSTDSRAIMDLDAKFNHHHGASAQNARTNSNNYNCDMNKSSAHDHPELMRAVQSRNDDKFGKAASRLIRRSSSSGENNSDFHIQLDNATPAVVGPATRDLPPIQMPPQVQTLGIEVDSKSVARTKRRGSRKNSKTIEGLSAHHNHCDMSTLSLATMAKRSPNASASSQQATVVPPTSSTQERRITIMLIAVVILFLVCQIPSAALLLYTSVRDIKPNTNEHALELAFGNIFNFLMAVNAAGNFILYSFLSKKYRRTFVLLFCGCLGTTTRQAGVGSGAGGTQHKPIPSYQPNRMISVRFDPPTGQAQKASRASSYQQQDDNNNKSNDRKARLDTLV